MKVSHDSESLKEGQQVITVCAFIYRRINNQIEIFLPRRAKTKKFLPHVYELPGGHVDFGEELIPALKREIFEEFQVKIDVGSPFEAFTYANHIKKSHSVEIVYFAQLKKEQTIQINLEDHADYKWLSEDKLPQAYTPKKNESDPEIQIIKRGFSLLNGKPLNF